MSSKTTNSGQESAALSPTKLALLKIRELKQQLAEAQSDRYEDIAIVSMACRFPRHSNTPEAYWESLISGSDEVSEIPSGRWDLEAYFDENPDAPGKMYARNGVFLDDLDLMDADFFGISPREATWIDPQQRLLLEVSWETLERAGWPSDRIGGDTGLFIGWMHNDYQNESSDSLLNLNPYIATGSAGSFLCGRLSYYLGLQGPSLAVDTACSSSLVALHLAIQSLHRRECQRALVGGVNAIVSPTTNILTCKLRALSIAGHSRAFDASADGYLRGEGCGVIALRRLSDAERDGDPVLAVIRGSAIGHNGFSSGLTAPNPAAQERVIREALHRAGVEPSEVDYLEAHGTGTELGDPIEMQAAAAALSQDRDKQHPLLVGSVKTNIGHLEAAAGIAGLIKVVLAMQHDSIPGQLGFEQPNPYIPWDELPVKVLVEPTVWPTADRKIAGVSAFGMSGTNAHVVIQGLASPTIGKGRTPSVIGSRKAGRNGGLAVDSDRLGHDRKDRNGADGGLSEEAKSGNGAPSDTRPNLLVMSAKSEDALRDLAGRYRDMFRAKSDLALEDVCRAAGVGRRHFEHRAALVANSNQQMLSLLDQVERGATGAHAFRGRRRSAPKVAWQFTGQGSQYVGMAQGLYETQPVFRDTLDHCDSELRKHREGSLLQVLFQDESLLHDTHWTQPGLFAIQMGMVRLLQSWGLQPDIVLGHSVGQYAAACVAGVMRWDEGLKLISERGRLIGELPSGGSMVAVFSSIDEAAEVVDAAGDISLAALNGSHIVLSGAEQAVASVVESFEARGVRCKPLKTSHAFHSALMEPMLDQFERIAGSIEFQAAAVPLICNVSGDLIAADQLLDAAYWRRHIRQPVQFADSVHALGEFGCDVILEVGPQPILTAMAASSWRGEPATFIPCLRREEDDRESLLLALANLYSQGATPLFSQMDNRRSPAIQIPTYPFQRKRFWGPDKPQSHHAQSHTAHPLLGGKQSLAGARNETRHESWVAADAPVWMPDHKVMNDVVFPGAAYAEMALAVSKTRSLKKLAFEQPLRLSKRTALQTVVKADAGDGAAIEVYSSPEQSEHWIRNFSATEEAANADAPGSADREAIAQQCPETAEPADFYEMMSRVGLHYGPQFRTIQSLRYGERDVLARLQSSGDVRGYLIPPPILDGAFQSLAIGLLRDADASLLLPVGVDRLQCFKPIENEVWAHAVWNEPEGETKTADITLFDDSGVVLVRIQKLKLRPMNRAALRKISGAGPERLLYSLNWQPSRLAEPDKKLGRWLVVSDKSGGKTEVASQLESQGQTCVSVTLQDGHASPDLSQSGDNHFLLGVDEPENWTAVLQHVADIDQEARLDGVVWLTHAHQDADSDGGPRDDSTRLMCTGLLGLVRAFREHGIRRLDRGLQLVTRHGVATNDRETVDPYMSQFWGLGRVIGAEQPGLRCRLLDVDADSEEPEALVDVLLIDSLENQIALREKQLHVVRLQTLTLPKNDLDFAGHPEASYLITGGLGMLGRQAAKWLANKGAGHIVLMSRRPPTESAERLIDDIQQQGCQVRVHCGDISSAEDIDSLFARFGDDLPELKGVIHAAGVLDDGMMTDQTWERFEKVFSPKRRGAWLLHEKCRDKELDFFVLYSSVASILGSPGQSNYATANAFLDGLAQNRVAAGLPALSINWGPWTEGMADSETVVKRLAVQGITPLTGDECHAAMEKMIVGGASQATVLDVDWRRMRRRLGGDAPPMLDELAPASMQASAGDSALVEKLRGLQPAARKRLLAGAVQNELQQVLSMAEPPDPDTPLSEFGLDSLMAVEFSTRLQQQLGDDLSIAPTLLFDYPTVNALSEYLLGLLTELPVGETPSAPVREQPTEREAIAIIGMGCRFPGSPNLQQYWRTLLAGVDAIGEIPADRWDVDEYYSATPAPGKMYTREGGFLSEIGEFDAEFFGISGQEACWIDPQHRMLLEVSWEALEDAGLAAHPVADSRVGVFMGIMSQDYAQLHSVDNIEMIDGFQGAGLSHSAGVGRLSYLFGFEGPSIAIDTASSSSLVAVCQAAKSLLDGNCNLALAGGVNAILTPTNSLLLSKAKMLSPEARCKSFSAAADGFARGEGCGVVVLKRLSDAERDGDNVMAVIRGTAVAHNGYSGALTSPSSRSQERVIQEALVDAGLKPAGVQYLEAHGTGTPLGDPIEIRAAASVFGKGRPADKPLLVGSVKANIGHLEAAGGVSGLIKTVLAMQHGVIPRQLHFDEPSPHVPWAQLPLEIVTEQTPWPECEERIAGVSAFGMSGTNAHVVLSACVVADANDDMESWPSPQVLLLSAKNSQALKELASRYDDFFSVSTDASLADVCYTAAVGRRHFDHRAALVVESANQTQQLLSRLSSGRAADGLVVGQARRSPKVAWLFSGAESPWRGAGKAIYDSQPAFREVLDQCEARFQASQGSSLLAAAFDVVANPVQHSLIQPAVFARQMALARLWQSWGVDPDVVLGHGVGQFAAACLAGAMSLDDGLDLVVARSVLEESLQPEAASVVVFAPIDEVTATVEANSALACYAANGSHCIVTGLKEEVAAVAQRWREAGFQCEPLPTAFSGPLASAEQLDAFETAADEADYFPADRPIICNLDAKTVPVHRLLAGSYWRRHLVESIRFADSIKAVSDLQCEVVMEIGPGSATCELAASCWDGEQPAWVATLREGQSEMEAVMGALARLYVGGVTPDFASFRWGDSPKRIELPTYPFQRKRYWITEIAEHLRGNGDGAR